MTNKILLTIAGVLLAVILALGWTAFHFYGVSVGKDGELSQARSDLDTATVTNAQQAFQFQRANEISAAAGKYNVTISAKSEERQNENRNDLKTEECADRYIPDATAQRLYAYTNGLRADAMRDTSKPDGAVTDSTAAGKLTYRQAVLWIDPLLTILDRANNDRASIRNLPHQQPTPQEQP
ncbi:DUF2570 domain-containing protein [Serratia plymuthica]|uniref:DUF2570 domain-containing protein n=1 Tax=Serratia plymuthica TaxID=82996 RepID=UPI001927D1A8|nr:DUF2570 domain-containing protein [Serratia plymuthica]MBL3524137.1 DUF2570 domain-containing protein [Serratia plymuthica]